LPTETVYGLAGDACNNAAVASIFALKGRPSFNPLIVHVGSLALARSFTRWGDTAEALAQAFWPGPVTLVLPREQGCLVSLLASAGGNTLALRMPAHPIARQVLEAFGGGLAAPSANRSGRISPTMAAHVRAEFPSADLMILDGGPCIVGIESTVVDCTGDVLRILRPGSITAAQIRKLGMVIEDAAASEDGADEDIHSPLLSPGMLSSHYAPRLPVRINVHSVEEGEALLAFGSPVGHTAARVINLSESGNVDEAAARLFAALHELDSPRYRGIAVMPVPEEGLGIAINDRLRRAAAERGEDS